LNEEAVFFSDMVPEKPYEVLAVLSYAFSGLGIFVSFQVTGYALADYLVRLPDNLVFFDHRRQRPHTTRHYAVELREKASFLFVEMNPEISIKK